MPTSTSKGETVGFIGVGFMGHGMAKNIVEKGYPLTIMGHRNRQPVDDLVQRGAIGNICFRFFDRDGRDIDSPTMERVIGIELEQLRRVPRAVLVCGGEAKHEAIGAALRGGLADVLITDQFTAASLLD